MLRPTLSLALLSLLLAPCAAQDSLDKFRRYLDRKPYHATVFDQLVDAASSEGSLAVLEQQYADRIAESEEDDAARVVLARLLARRGEAALAWGLLDEIGEESAELVYLRGRLRVDQDLVAEGAHLLDRAAGLTTDPRLASEILELAANHWMRADQPSRAEASLVQLAERDPADFAQRMAVADLMAANGLDDAASVQLEAALEGAGGDAEKVVRVRVATGRLHERAGRSADAQREYAAAAELLGPGHWMHADLFERRLAIHRARGTIDVLVERCRADLEAVPSDAGRHRLLASALRAAGRTDEAARVLGEAAAAFPDSLEVGLEHARLLGMSDRIDEAVREYQRLADRHTAELGLHREAGVLLASAGEREAARTQWDLELDRLPHSVDLRLELAAVQAGLGMHQEAEDLLMAAARLAPDDLRPVRALAEAWRGRGREPRVRPLLDEAQRWALSNGDAHLLEELAEEWLAREHTQRAIAAFEEALEAGGDRAVLLPRLATLLEEEGPFTRTSQVLFELLEHTQDALDRYDVASRIVFLHERQRRGRALAREQARRIDRDPSIAAARLVWVRALAGEGDFDEAEVQLDALESFEGFEEDVLWHRVWLAGEAGRSVSMQVRALRRIADANPRHRRHVLERIVQLYRGSGRDAAAERTEEELLSLGVSGSETYRKFAERRLRKREPDEALELLDRALAFYPGDDEIRLMKAGILLDLDRVDEARGVVELSLDSRDPFRRAEARALCSRLVDGPALVARIELGEEAEREPERWTLGVIRAVVARESFDLDEAERIVDELEQRFPLELCVLETREELRGLTAISLAEPLPLDSPVYASRGESLRLADLLLAQGDLRAARAALDALGSPPLAATLCAGRGEYREAVRILDRACRDDPGDPLLWMRLAVVARLAGDGRATGRALERAVQIGRSPWPLVIEQGEELARRGHRSGAREVGAKLFELLEETRSLAGVDSRIVAIHEERIRALVAYHVAGGLDRELVIEGERQLRGQAAGDPVLLEAVVLRADRRNERNVRGLLARARQRERPVAGWDAGEWKALLDRLEALFAE